MLPFQLVIAALGGWLQREQADVIAYLREENRILKARIAGRRLRFDDDEHRRLAEVGHRLRRARREGRITRSVYWGGTDQSAVPFLVLFEYGGLIP